jgi:DNA-binding beta-propeller fold protein YncE
VEAGERQHGGSVRPGRQLQHPIVVAVGDVYVSDTHTDKDDKGFPYATSRVIKLAAGSNTQTVLPFIHSSLAVDPAGTVWVVDEQLVKLAAGSNTQTMLPPPRPRCAR